MCVNEVLYVPVHFFQFSIPKVLPLDKDFFLTNRFHNWKKIEKPA